MVTPTFTGATPARSTPPPWFRSPYDGQEHITGRRLDQTVEALCEHSAPVAAVEDPGGEVRRPCLACLLLWGAHLADQHGNVKWM